MGGNYEVTTGKRLANWFTARFAGLGVGNFVVLTAKGRESGRDRSVTLASIADGEATYLVAPYGVVAWVLNVRSNPAVSLKKGRKTESVTLVDVTGEKPDVVQAYYERERFPRPFMDLPEDPTLQDFVDAGSAFPVFRVKSAT